MDMIESIDSIFQNLYINIIKSNGDSKLIDKYIKDTQYTVLCYTIATSNNEIETIKSRSVNKNCLLE